MHDNFVFAPADKASNNIIVICKQYYHKVLCDELGLFNNSGSSTYQKVTDSLHTILDKHQEFLSKFNLKIWDEHNNLPNIYALPKLHKNPYKFRFIVGSKFCTTKELSVLLSKALKKVQEFWLNYCGQINATSGGVNRF